MLFNDGKNLLSTLVFIAGLGCACGDSELNWTSAGDELPPGSSLQANEVSSIGLDENGIGTADEAFLVDVENNTARPDGTRETTGSSEQELVYGDGQEGSDSLRSDPAPPTERTQVLFGDTHVHTRNSLDAFLFMAQDEGELLNDRDVAEACDYARFCADVDFFVSSDHAEFLTEENYTAARRQVRDCNLESAGLPGYEDFMAFMGFEWTQTQALMGVEIPGITDSISWGHKIVFFLGDQDEDLPARPIASMATPEINNQRLPGFFEGERLANVLDGLVPPRLEPIDEFVSLLSLDACPQGIPSNEIGSTSCFEYALTPNELFTRLSDWGLPVVVGAHGTAWGEGGPGDWDAQVNPTHHWPEYQVFFEVYSKHGNSEVYRDWAPEREWRDIRSDEACEEGERGCEYLCVAPPSDQNYMPCCWRRVELTLEHGVCRRPNSLRCQLAVLDARRDGEDFEPQADDDWLACGECVDCFQPAAEYNPAGSIQSGLALVSQDDGERFYQDVGFIGSTDTHHAAPASVTEIKTFAEMVTSERLEGLVQRLSGESGPPLEQAVNFLYAGGLAAVHLPSDAEPTREGLFEAIQEGETFATSGPRMLLWFYLTNPAEELPMGSVIQSFDEEPQFRVHVLGDFRDTRVCPDNFPTTADNADFIEGVCRNVCHSPAYDEPRLKITHIEVIRIRRQLDEAEAIGELIDDVWLTLPCQGDLEGDGEEECFATFSDPEFTELGRDVVYYVRAIQETTLAVNGQPLGCIGDDSEGCTETRYCDQGNDADECLYETNERAWSSPIYLYRSRP